MAVPLADSVDVLVCLVWSARSASTLDKYKYCSEYWMAAVGLTVQKMSLILTGVINIIYVYSGVK